MTPRPMATQVTSPLYSFVIAGLDPAIHCADARNDFLQRPVAPALNVDAEPGRSVDCRVKPGNDDSFGVPR
jgi:hypothetical protein